MLHCNMNRCRPYSSGNQAGMQAMSRQLAVSAALSIMLMAGFVLFGSDIGRLPMAADSLLSPVRTATGALADPAKLLPAFR
jgi:hypothetical protein